MTTRSRSGRALLLATLVAPALVVGACSHTPPPNLAPSGAVAPRRAVEEFLAAVRGQDLQAMSVVWGNSKGPARDQFDRTELEKREIIMQGCFEHDKFQILDEAPGIEGHRIFHVELSKGPLKARPRFVTVEGPSGRWYVEDADIQAVQQLCRS